MRIIGGVVFTLLVGAAILVGYVYSGAYNIAATAPHSEFGTWLLDTTKANSVRQHASDIEPPALDDPRMVAEGFRTYQESCEECHGAPGVEPEKWARSLRPDPPDLEHAAEQLDPAELFWVAKHGLKMTGMPAWGESYSDQQLWSVVAFMQRLPRLSAAEYRRFESMFAAFEKEGDGQSEPQPEHAGEPAQSE